jgi:hypothetical protein
MMGAISSERAIDASLAFEGPVVDPDIEERVGAAAQSGRSR